MEGGDFSVSSIDTRVVEMKFDNDEFQRRSADTLKSLDSLNKGLKLDGATKGLHDIGAAGKGTADGIGHLASAVESIGNKFKATSVVAITALATIAHQAIATGTQLIKSLTIAPIMDGFREYETNLNSIQTIMANTGLEGASGLKRVTDALDLLNAYSDQTIYNFSEMARNIGTFTAAGVKLDVATGAIKGIANLAAVSGSNAQQASAAMYQLSQALAAGKLTLIDWNSVVNAGMGGKVFQDSLIQTARVHGVKIDEILKKQGSFRASLEEGWITADILTETLNKFTGDYTDAQLKAMGYSQQQIADIQKMARVAQDAATKVKTFTQLIGTIKESVGSGWARTWQIIFGDFDEARNMFTSINDVIGGFVSKTNDARNKVLMDWKELGGRTVLLEGIKNVFLALGAVITPIKDAFKEFFPAITGQRLYELTVMFRNFTETLKIGADTGANIRRTFAGIFAVFSLIFEIVGEGVKFFLRLFGVITEGSGSILETTANWGDFLVALVAAIRAGDGVRKFFEGLSDFLEPPIRLLKSLGALFTHLFDGFSGKEAAKGITDAAAKAEPLARIGTFLSNVWQGMFKLMDNVLVLFYKLSDRITEFLSGLGVNTSEALQGINLEAIFGVLTGGAFLSLLVNLRNIGKGAADIVDSLTDSLGAMQNTLRAATLLQIALAIGVLTISVVALSKVDAGSLASSLTAITVMFGQLLAFMLVFEKLSGFTGFAKMPFIAASMILLGGAIVVLAVAVRLLSDLSWEELARGLVGLTAILDLVIATMKLMPPTSGMFATAVALTVLGAAIHILVGAVTDLAAMSWEDMARGLTGVAALLASLTLFTMFAKANATGVLAGAGMILLATAIHMLGGAVKDFANMSWAQIGKGMAVLAGLLVAIGLALALVPPTAPLIAAGFLILAPALIMIGEAVMQMAGMSWAEIGRGMTVLAGALLAIGLALTLIPPTAPLVAAGILLLAPALVIIGNVIKSMAGMSWEEIGKGMTVLAGSLLILGVAVTFMSGAIAGAAALVLIAGALAVLAPVMKLLGSMSWGEIGKGLVALAGAFLIIGVLGAVLGVISPLLIAFGLALTLIGVGVLAAGAGVFFFASALTALAIAGTAGITALVAIVGALAGLIPTVMKQIGLAIVAFAQGVAEASPAMIGAIVAILMALLTAIDQLAPKIMETVAVLLTKMLDTILKHMPHMVDAGLKIVVAFLDGVANNIGKVVDSATNLAIKFLDGLQRNLPKLIQKGVDFVLAFVNGVANAIRDNSSKMGEAGANLATAMIEGMVRGLAAGLGRVVSKAVDLAKSAFNAAKNALGISSPSKEFMWIGEQSAEGMAVGLEAYSSVVNDAAESVGEAAVNTLRATISRMAAEVSDEMDTQPVIRPVLDLSEVRKQASNAGSIFSGLNTSTSFSDANEAAAGFRGIPPRGPDDDPPTAGAMVFNQYNNSPKALTNPEIYRQTKNLLSVKKGGSNSS